jgi:hypothetical protein
MAKASKKISRISVVADVEHDVNLDPSAGVTLCHPDDTFRRISFITKDTKSVAKRQRKKKSKGLSKAEQEELNSEMQKIYKKCKKNSWKKITHNPLTGEPSNNKESKQGYESYNDCVKYLKEHKWGNKTLSGFLKLKGAK